MFNKIGYNKNLEELVKANKADISVAEFVKGNLDKQRDCKNAIKQNEKEINKLNKKIEKKDLEKKEVSFINVKENRKISKEISDLKKELKNRKKEIIKLEEEIKLAEEANLKIEEEIATQYKIYQENEIFSKSFDAINEKDIELLPEIYTKLSNQINEYNNTVYSVANNTKLIRPEASDLVTMLNVLKKNDEKIESDKKSNVKKSTSTTKKSATKSAKKNTTKNTTKKTTSETKKNEEKLESNKKSETKKSASTVKKDNKKTATKKA